MPEKKISKFLHKLFYILDVIFFIFRITNTTILSHGIVTETLSLSKMNLNSGTKLSLNISVLKNSLVLFDSSIYTIFTKRNPKITT